MTEHLFLLGARDGVLLVASDEVGFLDRYAVRQGSTVTRFEPSRVGADVLLRGVDLLVAGELAPERAWQLEGPLSTDEAILTRNVNREWVVEGRSPWLLAVGEGVETAVMTRVDPLLGTDIPVQGDVNYELSGHFACIQARGRVVLSVLDAHGEQIAERTAALHKAHRGGTTLASYQPVSLRHRLPAKAAYVRVRVEITGADPDPTALTRRPMLFVLDCSLTPWPDWVPTWTLHPAGVSLLAQAGAGHGRAQLFEAPVELGGASGADLAEVISLADSAKSVATFRPALPGDLQVGIEEFGGNFIKVSVSGTDQSLAVYIDGQLAGHTPPVASAKAATRRTPGVVVAERWADGNPHVVEVRDSTGCVVLARTEMVLPRVLTPWEALQRYSSHPLPYQLAPTASHRYRALRAQVAKIDAKVQAGEATADDLTQFAQLNHVHHVLEVGFEKNRDFRPLIFPQVEHPKVSIVVPVHDKFAVTYHCLASLLLAMNEATFEVIVVDDGSSDETLELDRIAPGVVVCRNEEAVGFVGACNLGASKARGEYVVLLNNDTEPTAGWLDELVAAFDRFDRVGLAGSRLLYPDGRLQDAGGIVWETGNPWNYGRGANPADPRFSYARQADYLSGAAMMIPRTVWEEVGGLSKEFAPAYFEDTDIAFKVRDAGYTTWFVPSSEVYHFEGLSNGTDVNTTSGLKRFQEVNRPKFKAKWAGAVTHNGKEGQHPDLVKDRGILGRALFVDHAVPRPDRDAGSFAAIQEMRLVQSLGYKVTFAAINVAYMGKYSDELNKMGIETIHAPFALSIDGFLQSRGTEFDLVYLTRYNIANQVLASVRQHAPQAKILFCNADLHFLRHMRLAQLSGDQAQWEKAVAIRDAELKVMREVDVVLSYNEVEHSVIQSHNLNSTKVVTCPWVVDEVDPADVPSFSERAGIAFLGGYAHPPNVEAVEFFVEDVLPKLRDRVPDVQFNIYGADMPDKFKQLADDVISPIGYVETVDEVYHHNRVFVAPLLTGAGIKGKVIGALAHGIPSVISPVAAEGTGVRTGVDCLVAANGEEWVEAIAALYTDEEHWTRMSRSALDFTRQTYSFDRGRELMRAAFHAAEIYRVRD